MSNGGLAGVGTCGSNLSAGHGLNSALYLIDLSFKRAQFILNRETNADNLIHQFDAAFLQQA